MEEASDIEEYEGGVSRGSSIVGLVEEGVASEGAANDGIASKDTGNDAVTNEDASINAITNTTNTPSQEPLIRDMDVEESTDDDLADDTGKLKDVSENNQLPASSNSPCSSTTFLITVSDSLTVSLQNRALPILSLSVSALHASIVFTDVCVATMLFLTRSLIVPYRSSYPEITGTINLTASSPGWNQLNSTC